MAALPRLDSPLDDMNESELKSFIPKMIREATGRPVAGYGKVDLRPEWWPRSVAWCNPKYDNRQRNKSRKSPWKNVLKAIIKACYEHYGREHMLKGGVANGRLPLGSGAGAVKMMNNENGSVSFITDDAVLTVEDRNKTKFRDRSGIPFEAATPTGFQSAVDPVPARVIKTRAALPQCSKTDPTSSENADEAEDKSLIEIFICFYCEKEFKGKSVLQKHQGVCIKRPQDITYIGSPPRNKKRPSRKSSYKQPDVRPSKSGFVEFLGLVPIEKAEKLKNQQNKEKEIACEVIEVEEQSIPKTPTTPRTPKSLISQLSRDVSPLGVVRRLDPDESSKEKKDGAEDAGSDCGKSDNGEEDLMDCRRIHSLLAIDLSSALGQRIKKHIPEADKELFTVKNPSDVAVYEEYCHTPVKNEFQSRLRHRDNPYPVSFRPRRRPGKFCHEYSFSKRQRKERYMVMKTGMNGRSRDLRRRFGKCTVHLRRLTKEEIKEATRRRPRPPGWSPHLQHHLFMSPEQMQQVLRLQQGKGAAHRGPGPVQFIDLSQFDSSDFNAEIQRQRADIYNRLITDSGMQQTRSGFSGELTPPSSPDPSSPLQQLLHSQRQHSLKSSPYFSSSNIHPVMSNMINGPSHRASAPSNSYRPRPAAVDCDVISISSSDDEGKAPPASMNNRKRKRLSSGNHSKGGPQKRRTESGSTPSALLFRCHICHVEITCKQNAAQTIKAHFVNIHGVSNIDLVEHNDDKGQKVVSIVEVSVPKLNPSTPPDIAQPTQFESAATSRPNLPHNNNTSSQMGKTKSQTEISVDQFKTSRRLFENTQKARKRCQSSSKQPRRIVGIPDDDDIICLD